MSPVKPITRPTFLPADLPGGELPRLGIRVASPADLPALQSLAYEATATLCAAEYSAEQVRTLVCYGLGADVQLVRDRTCYIVEHAGQVIASGAWSYRAALMGRFHPDDEHTGSPRDILDPAVHPARLRALFVHPSFARRGLGRMMVALCERLASAAGFSGLELLATPVGRRLFLACGFRDVEPVTHIFPNGVDAGSYRMHKPINPADYPNPTPSAHSQFLGRSFAQRN